MSETVHDRNTVTVNYILISGLLNSDISDDLVWPSFSFAYSKPCPLRFPAPSLLQSGRRSRSLCTLVVV